MLGRQRLSVEGLIVRYQRRLESLRVSYELKKEVYEAEEPSLRRGPESAEMNEITDIIREVTTRIATLLLIRDHWEDFPEAGEILKFYE